MANIYLRLPVVLAAYIRNRCRKPLMADEPVRFSIDDFEECYALNNMMDVASNIVEEERVSACFTQSQWNNMMRGIPPNGGHQLMKRDQNVYLDYSEISELSGVPVSDKTSDFDYLCIEIPKVVYNTRGTFKTNASWKLTRLGVKTMNRALRDAMDFGMLMWRYEWRKYIFLHANELLIERRDVDMWERFLMAYDIPISNDRQRESFKKMCQRLSDDEYLKSMRERIKQMVDGEIARKDTCDKVHNIVNLFNK